MSNCALPMLREVESLMPPAKKPHALCIMDAETFPLVFSPRQYEKLCGQLDVFGPPMTSEEAIHRPDLLKKMEILVSSWGAPILDEPFLNAAPGLKAVFYGAGSIRYFTPEPFWERGIVISSAQAANAVPVAEYTLSVILLSLKHFWKFSSGTRNGEGWGNHLRYAPGGFGSTVGLVSFGMIARRLVQLLCPFDLRIAVFCPWMSSQEAKEWGVELVGLEELFRTADVVSLHAPDLPETRGLITGSLLSSMKPGSTFINTARGAIVREVEMIEVLQNRPDLTAVLDVCEEEPPAPNNPLPLLPNVVLTPHIAGSLGREIQRLGDTVLEEVERYLNGSPLKWEITREMSQRIA